MRSKSSRADRGAAAVIIALVLPVVLLLVGGLIVDVGSWYSVRAQNQNGADGAALAVAASCARGACDTTLAFQYATTQGSTKSNGNSNGNFGSGGGAVRLVCGNPSPLTPCSDPSIPASPCPTAPAGTNYVNVQTISVNTIGLSGSLLNNKTKVAACAQARWGAAGGGSGLALTMSICDWLADTGASYAGDPNAKFANPKPPYPPNAWPPAYPKPKVDNNNPVVPNVAGENVVQVTGPGKCGAGQSGNNVPGGFGWLSDNPNHQIPANCQVSTTANGYVYSSSGGLGGANGACASALTNIYNSSNNGQTIPNANNPIFLPIFDLACSTNGFVLPDKTVPCPNGMPNDSYHIAGYATFVLTGASINPIGLKSLISKKEVCDGGNYQCVYGLFTTGLVQSPTTLCTTPPCPNLGPTVVELTG